MAVTSSRLYLAKIDRRLQGVEGFIPKALKSSPLSGPVPPRPVRPMGSSGYLYEDRDDREERYRRDAAEFEGYERAVIHYLRHFQRELLEKTMRIVAAKAKRRAALEAKADAVRAAAKKKIDAISRELRKIS